MGVCVRFYLKLFSAGALPFGAWAACWIFIMQPHSLAGPGGGKMLLLIALLGGGFGLLLSLLFGTWQIVAVRRLGFPITPETLAVHHVRNLTLACSFDQAFTRCLDAVRALKGAEVLEETDYQQGVIHARKAWSMSSFGETIQIDLLEDQPGRTRLTLRCGPTLRSTWIDYGTNLRNLDVLVAHLLAEVDAPRPTSSSAAVQPSPEAARGNVRVGDPP